MPYQSQLITTITELAPDTTTAQRFHLQFRSFDDWKHFNIAWYEASGSSVQFYRNIAHALEDVVRSFPVEHANSAND